MGSVGRLWSGLSRTFSDEVHGCRSRALRLGGAATDAPAEPERKHLEVRTAAMPPVDALPAASLQSAPSVASDASDVGSPTAASLDSPTAAAASGGARGAHSGRRLRINGMDAYDYWTLIKSL